MGDMKGERRHELQQNELLVWLDGWIRQIGPYRNLILGAALVAVVAIGGWKYWSGQTAAGRAGAWEQLYGAIASRNPAEVKAVAEQHPGSDVAQWAAVVAGDMYLSQGCDELFKSKATAGQELQKAVEEYLTVLDEDRSGVLHERATFGLARTYEALAGTEHGQGGLPKAVEQYEALLAQWPEGTYTAAAERRLEDINRPQIKAFYDKFAQYDPQPFAEGATEPGGGLLNMPGGGLPTELRELLDGMDSTSLPDFAPSLGLDAPGDADAATPDTEPAPEEGAEEAPVETEDSPGPEEGTGPE